MVFPVAFTVYAVADCNDQCLVFSFRNYVCIHWIKFVVVKHFSLVITFLTVFSVVDKLGVCIHFHAL